MISIITPVYNQATFICQAIESVLQQDNALIEHIVIDGGSTDGTLDVLGQYTHLKIFSGRDKGMYDALNKGLELVQGDVIGFLNSDDLYSRNVFSGILPMFYDKDVQAVIGGAIVFSESPAGTHYQLSAFSPEDINSLLELTILSGVFFNAWFFRRSIFEKIGNFRENYRVAADREFLLRFALSGLKYEILNKVVYMYRQHSNSMTFNPDDQKIERIVREHIFMTDSYFEQEGLPSQAKNFLRDLRTRNTLEMAVRSLKKLNLFKFCYFLQRGMEWDANWFQKFARRIIRAGRNFVMQNKG